MALVLVLALALVLVLVLALALVLVLVIVLLLCVFDVVGSDGKWEVCGGWLSVRWAVCCPS